MISMVVLWNEIDDLKSFKWLEMMDAIKCQKVNLMGYLLQNIYAGKKFI